MNQDISESKSGSTRIASSVLTWNSIALFSLVLFCFLGLYSSPIWDIDFWWHIATGREIVSSGHLSSADPLGVYVRTDGPRAQFLIKGYWLAQVIMFSTYSLLGSSGVVLMRALTLTASIGLLFISLRKTKADNWYACFITILAGLILVDFTGDRPQIFSFLCIALLALLLPKLLQGSWTALLIPLLMALWTNMHGGSALGAVLLGVLLGVLPLEWHRRHTSLPKLARIYFIGSLAILATLASPNLGDLYRLLLNSQQRELQARTSEYLSPWTLTLEHGIPLISFWLFFAVSIVIIIELARDRRWAILSTILLLGALSLSSFRYVPFFVLWTGIHAGGSLHKLNSRLNFPARLAAAMTAVALLTLLAFTGTRTLAGKAFATGIDHRRFPIRSLEIIGRYEGVTKVFNHINWGGYISYHEAHNIRPFIDGRNLDLEVFAIYTNILWTTELGKRFLDGDSFDAVVVPQFNPLTGERYPIVDYLSLHSNWRSVISGDREHGFVRAPLHAPGPTKRAVF